MSKASAMSMSCGREPSFLLITQNMGSIEVCMADPEEARAAKTVRVEKTGKKSTAPGEEPLLSEGTKKSLKKLVGDLRRWIFFLSSKLDAKRNEQVRMLSKETPTELGDKVEERGDNPFLPDIIVIHFQEIGGKGRCLPVNKALGSLLAHDLLPEAGWNSGLLIDDEDPKRFTALGTIIFISKRLCPITSMLSIPHKVFMAIQDDPCTYGGSRANVYKAARFKGARNSRKGFLLTSLRIGDTAMSFCNCHLYHDESNEDATVQTPSAYFNKRREGFLEMVSECLKIVKDTDPLFIFGDFNSRLDGKSLLEYVKQVHQMDVVPSAKTLKCPVGFWELFRNRKTASEIRARFDIEPQLLMDAAEESTGLHLGEIPVRFTATFKLVGFNEESEKQLPTPPRDFSPFRIPAWCDRILFNPAALKVLSKPFTLGLDGDSKVKKVTLYNTFSLPFADHDGVYLLF